MEDWAEEGKSRRMEDCLNQDWSLTGGFTEASRRFLWSLDFIRFLDLELCVLRESGFWLYFV